MTGQPDPDFAHRPVMADEIVELFAPVPAGWLVDATLGGAGHATALLEAHPQLKVLGIDQPKVSALLRGKLTGFSTERLIRFLNALGRDVEIVVKDRQKRGPGHLQVVTA